MLRMGLFWFMLPLLFSLGFKAIPRDAQRHVLLSVCDKESDLTRGKPGSISWSCTRCPTYTGTPGLSKFEIQDILEGSFSAPNRQETLSEITGCEMKAHTGGLVLSRFVGGHYKRLFYMGGISIGRCLNFQDSAGKDILACESSLFSEKKFAFRYVNVSVQGDEIVLSDIFPQISGDAQHSLVPTSFEKKDEKTLILSFQGSREYARTPAGISDFTLSASFDGKLFRLTSQGAKELEALRHFLGDQP